MQTDAKTLWPVRALRAVRVPQRYNYIGVFLTMACNYRCSYCINRHGGTAARGQTLMTGAQWVRGLNRLLAATDLPITLQGGEPSLHPDFLHILTHVRADLPIDILTNLQFDVDTFMAAVAPHRLSRAAMYASIRVSYHPEQMDPDVLRVKVLRLLERGYSVGVWAVDHPAHHDHIAAVRARFIDDNIDFRLKDFLGTRDGRTYGTYRYPEAVMGASTGTPVQCRTSELLISPCGSIHRCHSDLYAGRNAIGHLLDPLLHIQDIHRPCQVFGQCNPCDVKVKTDRFQRMGHTSVEIQTASGQLSQGGQAFADGELG